MIITGNLLESDDAYIANLPSRYMVGCDAHGYLTHANFKIAKKGKASKAANFFLDAEETHLAIAVSPEEVLKDFPEMDRESVMEYVSDCVQRTQHHWVPILQNKEHVYWGKPILHLDRSIGNKVVFVVQTSIGANEPTVFHISDTLSSRVTREDDTKGQKHEPLEPLDPPPTKRARKFVRVRYNGMAFDDRDEAQHAAFLDCLGIRWKPQPVSIVVAFGSEPVTYRPDFYVEELNAYLETTTTHPPWDKLQKCEALARHAANGDPDCVVYLVWGGMYRPFRYSHDSERSVMQIVKFSVVDGNVVVDAPYLWVHKGGGKYAIEKMTTVHDMSWHHEPLLNAYDYARTKAHIVDA